MSKIMISELQETTSAPDSSYIAIDNGTTTNKITIANYNENANATAKRYAEASQGYSNDALVAKDGAVSAKNEAETLANTTSSYANAARASADAAAGSASEASGYVGSAQTSATNALASARAAEASAAGIDDQVKLAKSWAVGNTGVRADEAVNNSMYWAGQAAAAAGGGVVSFNGRTGSVLPYAGDYSSDQVAHVNSDSTYTNVEAAINNLQTDVNGIQTDVSNLDVDKLDTYASGNSQWDTTPTNSSTKPVTSGGVYSGLSAKAPTSHASSAKTYGAGNANNYGHVKLSDNYTSSAGAASASVGASSKAVYDAYTTLNNKIVALPTFIYHELTTRNGNTASDVLSVVNANFLSSGYVTILKTGKQITVHFGGTTSKSGEDWIFCVNQSTKPFIREFFWYNNSGDQKRGYIDNDGYLKLSGLNSGNQISGSVIWNSV